MKGRPATMLGRICVVVFIGFSLLSLLFGIGATVLEGWQQGVELFSEMMIGGLLGICVCWGVIWLLSKEWSVVQWIDRGKEWSVVQWIDRGEDM